ncbi:hypothetical protein ABI021_14515, partial [Enterococcus faecium]
AQLPQVRSVVIETRVVRPAPLVLVAEPAAGADSPAQPTPIAAPRPVPPAPAAIKPVVAQAIGADQPAAPRPPLDPRFTFDRFVVDGANRVAF